MSLIKQKAIKLFINNTNFKAHQIKFIKQIHNGYTNISFVVNLINNQKYQIRLANDKGVVNRKNELMFLKNINNKNFIYFDIKTGNAIKEWIDGQNPNDREINTKEFLDSFSQEIKKLHSHKIKQPIIKHDNYEFINKVKNKLPQVYINKYLNLVNKYKDMKLVLSHNDLSQDNLLWNKKENKIHFIDFEWARINNQYWDFANFIRESNLSQKSIKYLANINKLNLTTLKDFIYICINYAYQWTFVMPQTKKILSYRKKLLKKLR